MRIKEMITKGELKPVLKQFLPTSTVRNALLFVFVLWNEYQYISHLDKGLDEGFSQ